ncbi:MAG TPA: hypothetical protein VGZ47_20990 [Gemmataceae bacterium]|jgi:hypothetical protein|nr:hypothetical protein [Gemmataceae bacterium]
MDETWRWFHITSHTYGAWLYGDPRGFRTRHHREHVEGDYKNPPPKGRYKLQLARSRKLLKQEPVKLTFDWQKIIGSSVRDKILELGAQLLCVSMGSTHLHLLAKMPVGEIPRHWVGQAKKCATLDAKDHGWTGKLWAVRCKVIPIENRQHQLNTYHYILDHIHEGAWVWDFRRGELTL